METQFRLVVANFRSDRLQEVEKKLQELGAERINVCRVKGFGEYHNFFAENWLTSEVRLEAFTRSDKADAVAGAIIEAAHTGVPGDGVVAVLPIEKLYLIRARCEATPENFWPRGEPMKCP